MTCWSYTRIYVKELNIFNQKPLFNSQHILNNQFKFRVVSDTLTNNEKFWFFLQILITFNVNNISQH